MALSEREEGPFENPRPKRCFFSGTVKFYLIYKGKMFICGLSSII